MNTIEVGQVLAGKLLVEGVLGKGGMGLVLVARHAILNERVAVKLLRNEDPAKAHDPQQIERFYREARAAARLKGDHITRVMDVGALEDGSPFIVMEHLEGETLAHKIREGGPLPIDEAVDLTLQTCEGLAEAHALGIIHRDLKPSNLMVVRGVDGLPLLKILDFGIARATLSESATLTGTAMMLGSPSYASPEQIRDAHRVDARTDVWSLGVTLYELLTGRRPFEAFSPAGLIALISVDPPTPLADLRPEVPLALQRIVLRCLEKQPEHRFASVAELAAELAPFGPPGAIVRAERAERVSRGRAPVAQGPTPPTSPRARSSSDEQPTRSLAETIAEPTLSEQVHSVTSPGDQAVRYSAPEIPLTPRRPPWGVALAGALGVLGLGVVLVQRSQTEHAQAPARAASLPSAAPSAAPSASPASPVLTTPQTSGPATPSSSVPSPATSIPAVAPGVPASVAPAASGLRPARVAADGGAGQASPAAAATPVPAITATTTSFVTDFGDRK